MLSSDYNASPCSYFNAVNTRFISVDPLQFKYPIYTPFQYAGNKPISFIDLDGAEPLSFSLQYDILKYSAQAYMNRFLGATKEMTNVQRKTSSWDDKSLNIDQTTKNILDVGVKSNTAKVYTKAVQDFFVMDLAITSIALSPIIAPEVSTISFSAGMSNIGFGGSSIISNIVKPIAFNLGINAGFSYAQYGDLSGVDILDVGFSAIPNYWISSSFSALFDYTGKDGFRNSFDGTKPLTETATDFGSDLLFYKIGKGLKKIKFDNLNYGINHYIGMESYYQKDILEWKNQGKWLGVYEQEVSTKLALSSLNLTIATEEYISSLNIINNFTTPASETTKNIIKSNFNNEKK